MKRWRTYAFAVGLGLAGVAGLAGLERWQESRGASLDPTDPINFLHVAVTNDLGRPVVERQCFYDKCLPHGSHPFGSPRYGDAVALAPGGSSIEDVLHDDARDWFLVTATHGRRLGCLSIASHLVWELRHRSQQAVTLRVTTMARCPQV